MKRRVLASLGAAAMMASVVTTGFAAVPVESDTSSADVDIVVTSTGVLSVLVTETERFDDISYSFSNQTVEGQLTIQVTDQRGTAAGWNFNLRGMGDFEGTVNGPGDSFPLTGLALEYASTTRVAGNTETSGISGSDLTQVTMAGQQIASADEDFGNGQYNLLYDGDLLIPGDTLVDTYKTVRDSNGKVRSSFDVAMVSSVATSNFQMTCTPNTITVATNATDAVVCSLSGVNLAATANVAVNSVTVSSVPGWTITRSPASGSLTGTTAFNFTLSLKPVCGAAVNPPAPNVTITSQLTFMSGGLAGPSTSITAKHGATSNVSASITGSTMSWSRAYSFAPQAVSGSMAVQVIASGCAGWNVQVSATAFNYTGSANGSPIANSSLSVAPGAPTAVSGTVANVSPGGTGTLGSPVKVLSAIENSGIGTYNQSLGLSVTIPGAARVGTYTSTITIAAASGP